MKVYKVELCIVDYNDELNGKEIKDVIENVRYPNHCMSPYVMKIDSRELGEWYDDHPLNYSDKKEKEYNRLFDDEKGGCQCQHLKP